MRSRKQHRNSGIFWSFELCYPSSKQPSYAMKQNLRIATVADLEQITVSENGEEMLCLNEMCHGIDCHPINKDMAPYTGTELWARRSVCDKLQKAQEHLSARHPGTSLRVAYAYRHPDIQRRYYEAEAARLGTDDPEAIHLHIAHPSVAGHPTGGAIDVTLIHQGQELDMGGQIANFEVPERIPTYSDAINEEQRRNRELLLELLMAQDFAPFYGEWWHFSYGDREWAYFYKRAASLFSELNFVAKSKA